MLRKIFYGFAGLIALIVVSLLTGCVNLALPLLEEDTSGLAAPTPEIDPQASWQDPDYRRSLLTRFEFDIYGKWPRDARIVNKQVKIVDAAAFKGRAVIEQWTLEIALNDGGPNELLPVTVAIPTGVEGPVPTFLMQDFCGTDAVFDREDVPAPSVPYPEPCSGDSMLEPLVIYALGRHISSKPVEDFIDRGVAFAAFYGGEILPDVSSAGMEKLEDRFGDYEPRPAAIGLWGWAFSMVNTALDADLRFDPERTAIYGHSRNGKAALVAGAFDTDIDLVISHQSGRGGAALNRSEVGESINQITNGYPNWFTPYYGENAENPDAFSVDQHQLMALIAPRPLMLGNSRRDTWADPASAWLGAQAADEVYEAMGVEGLRQSDMADEFDPTADLAFYLRNGRHGQTTADFEAFLSFMDAHFDTAR